MRLVLLSLAASLAVATPALAGEGRFDVQTGVDWSDGLPGRATIGGTVGYDEHIGAGAFVGVEESVDKVLASNTKARFGTTGRLGLKVGPTDKFYGLAGYTYGAGPNATHVGGGYEHSFGPIYGKLEYRHYFTEDGFRDSNAALVGAGIHF